MKKIYICTTFRDFVGSDNDDIQKLFLKSIQEQTYQNYEVVVTTFGEKNVESVVRSYFPTKSRFINVHLEKYRYSLSDVVINGVNAALEDAGSILVWSTGDVIWDKNMLEEIAKYYKPGFSGICHPNIVSTTINNYQAGKYEVFPIYRGIDFMFFDAELFRNKKIYGYLDRFRFYEWGAFEQFLAGIAEVASDTRINVFPVGKVYKIENNRAVNNETIEYLRKSGKSNKRVMNRFILVAKLSKGINKLEYCHHLYKPVKWNRILMLKRMEMKWNSFLKKIRSICVGKVCIK